MSERDYRWAMRWFHLETWRLEQARRKRELEEKLKEPGFRRLGKLPRGDRGFPGR